MKRSFLILRNILFVSGVIIFFSTNSCVEEKYDWDRLSTEIEINPSLAVPLIKGSLTLDDLLLEIPDEIVGRFPQDSLLYILYSDTFRSLTAPEIVDIPDQTLSQMFIHSDISPNPAWTASSPGDTVQFSKQKDAEFEFLHNEKIDSMVLKSGDIDIHVTSSFKHKGVLVIHSNSIKKNGQSFVGVIEINDASGSFNSTINIPLNNTRIYLDNSDPSKTVLPLNFDLFLVNSGASVNAGDLCNITMSFRNMQFSSVFGYLGDYNLITGQGEIEPNIFENIDFEDILNGELLFYDPKFKITTFNSIGIPINITLSNVSAYSEKHDITTAINFSGVNPFMAGAPNINNVGSTVRDSIEITRDNCNIVEAVNTSPVSINYDIAAETNPEGPSGPYNFITDNSRLDLIFEMLFPLWLKANGIVLEETMDMDVEKEIGSDLERINYLRITIEGKNEFPLRSTLQLTFLDSLDNAIDSLFAANFLILDPAEIGIDGKLKKAVEFRKIIEIEKDKIARIMDTKKILIRSVMNTSNSDSDQHIKLFSYYKIDFKMSLKTNLTINLNLN